ncbi:hypothetical protein MIND_00699800 [Mycena indigotica]|uniref:RNase III domain-containing protein n=1 Tax=Mycena indigotica TaxID=2126181 RepID=A0A8H6SMG7_9AGAR|nr:uncharacterized protein MIND_00699800 [Mycena indigotica]KAF7301346.1 hypothetical protein MIND_00699800 [Mycena indigotica]
MRRVVKQKGNETGHEFLTVSGTTASTGPVAPSDSQPPSYSLKRSTTSDLAPPSKRIKVGHDEDRQSLREIVIQYDGSDVHSKLSQRLQALDPSHPALKQAQYIDEHVGTCAADFFWCNYSKNGPTTEQDAKLVQIIKNWNYTVPNLDPTSPGFNVSPKFLRLFQIVKAFEPYGKDFRGIIFVKCRITATVIAQLFSMLSELLPSIKTFAFTYDDDQKEMYQKFESGNLNLAIATKSLEDLDFPDVTVVIRFDLSEELLSYAYHRSFLAAEKETFLVHMVNNGHQPPHLLRTNNATEPDLLRWIKIVGEDPAGAVPPIVLQLEPFDEGQEDAEQDRIIEPTTGGVITLLTATAVLYRLASRANDINFPSPLFDFHKEGNLYTCTLLWQHILPRRISGRTYPSKAHARRSACYNFCDALWRAGVLEPDAFLSPLKSIAWHSSELASRDTSLGVQVYPRKSPNFWSHSPLQELYLFPTVIIIPALKDKYAPLLLLTRQPLPTCPAFNLFLDDVTVNIEIVKYSPFTVEPKQLVLLHSYTLRLCRSVANKAFTCPIEAMPYFLAPLQRPWERKSPHSIIHDDIPWQLVAEAAESWCKPLAYGPAHIVAADVNDAVLLDRATELTRRYEALCVRPDLSPLSHPEDSPREASYANLLEYCKAVRKNFERLKDENQALVEIASVMTSTSHLDPAKPQQVSGPPPPKYLIPELCLKFTVPASTFRTALLFPSISRRLDSFLLVKELNARFFNHQIAEDLLNMAITTTSSRMEFDYERLELLGDSFLKYLASIYVFVNEPSNREGALHRARQQIVNNQCLFRSVDCVGLPAYIQSKAFSVKAWQPPNFQVTENAGVKTEVMEKKLQKEREQRLGDKVVADIAEAILGAAYLSGGRDVALLAAKSLNLPFPNVDTWADLRRKLLVPPAKISAKLASGTIEAVHELIGCKLTSKHLIAQALTHASISVYDRVSYERLEFIGDAILELLIVDHIYARNSSLTAGDLTVFKGSMGSNQTLAAICVDSGLYQHVLLSDNLRPIVEDYVQHLKAVKYEATNMAAIEGRSVGQYWQELNAPKVLSDVVESILGASYLSDDMVGAESVFDTLLQPFFNRYFMEDTVSQHPTKTLLERLQANKCLDFRVVKEKLGLQARCSIVVHGVILAMGEGSSTSLATRQASWCALDALDGDPSFLEVCNCAKEGRERKAIVFEDVLSSLDD